MDIIKTYSRRSLLLILVMMVLFAGAFAAVVFFGKPQLVQEVSRLATFQVPAPDHTAQVTNLLDTYLLYFIPAFALAALVFGVLLWLFLKRTVRSAVSSGSPVKTPDKKGAEKSAANNDNEQRIRSQRLFLHLLAVLQREGRLVDFLQEDLEMYEDEQIGTAVRTIHGSCKKILKKSLSMQPIIAGDEGEAFTVENGFDPDAIKLTGQVTGDPPFKGTIRHKGWRTQTLEMPDLSAIKDPTIICPAEVEIE